MIKKFEAYYSVKKKCWKVPSRYIDEFGAALMHIGMSDEEILFWTGPTRYQVLSIYNHIHIFYDGKIWSWSSSQPSDDQNYQGEVTISQEDKDEWELFITTKKYNL